MLLPLKENQLTELLPIILFCYLMDGWRSSCHWSGMPVWARVAVFLSGRDIYFNKGRVDGDFFLNGGENICTKKNPQ